MLKNKLKSRDLILVWGLSSFWLFTLMNPVFKKYDYGGGWPMVLVLCVLCLGLVFLFKGKKIGWSPSMKVENIFILVFLVFSGLSFVFSETKNIGFNELLAFYGAFCVYLTLAYRENGWMGRFLKIVVLGGILAALFGFFIYLFREAPPRMIGPFFNIFYHSHLWPNAFALFLVMTWPLMLLFQGSDEEPDRKAVKRANSKKVWSNRRWLLGLSLVLSALFLTYSRGAMIVFLGQSFLLIAYFWRKFDLKFLKKLFLVGVFSTVLVVSANLVRGAFYEDVIDISEKVTFQNQEGYTSVIERSDFFEGAFDMALERPFLGYGPYSFGYIYAATEQKDLLALADHPHNVFLKIGAENGLIAMSAFMLFLLSVLYVWIRRFKELEEGTRALSFVIGVSIAGAFAHNLIDYNLNFLANILLLFVLLAFFRSLVVQKFYTAISSKGKTCGYVIAMILSVVISVCAVFEGGVLVASHFVDEGFREFSLYPRNYYLNTAEGAMVDGEFGVAEEALNKHLELNPYEGQAYYLLGTAYFSALNPSFDERKASEYFYNATEVNPYNNLEYYREYLAALLSVGDVDGVLEIKDFLLGLLEKYEVLVKYNVHFTTYTANADAAVEIYRLLAREFPENVSSGLMQKADDLQDVIDEIRASRKL